MFHDIGLTESSIGIQCCAFEVDAANAARNFLRKYGVPESSVEMVWDAIALHAGHPRAQESGGGTGHHRGRDGRPRVIATGA
jgi:hypothetical protein